MFYKAKVEAAELGRKGEDLVAEYLRQKGYIVVKRNYKDRFGEIDIIAENKEEIAFVEVKTRREGALVSGLQAVDIKKAERIRKTALLFLNRLKISLKPRFDVAEVTAFVRDDGSVGYKLNYIKSAF